MRILGVCGSLRAGSTNLLTLRAAEAMVPPGVTLRYDPALLARLPPFNPDLDVDGEAPLPEVAAWRAELREADAVLVSSPEYAHGVPGALKNALDWIVGSGELTDKPVAIINTSARARHAWASLVETSTTMAARVIVEASILIPLDGVRLDAPAIAG